MKDFKLTIDLLPKGAWGNDFSKTLSKKDWDILRNKCYERANHKCAICGWDEDKDILEVHHIDENLSHNELENLIILCPICHRKLTSHKYKLINREQIVLC